MLTVKASSRTAAPMFGFVRCHLTIGPLVVPLRWNQERRLHGHRQQLVAFFSQPPTPSKKLSKRGAFEWEALSKQGQIFLTSLATATAAGDSSATNRLLKKFVASSSKPIVLNVLSHLLSPQLSHSNLSSLAFPVGLSLSLSSLQIKASPNISVHVWQLYLKITEARWFNWNPKLVANLAALLDKRGQRDESAILISDSISKLQGKERDLVLLYCNLVESHTKQNSIRGFDDSFDLLKQLVCNSNSVYVKRQGYKSMISGLCEMGRPREAEELIQEIIRNGVKPSLFEFRSVVHAYGRLGLIEEMQRSLGQMENEGFKIDTVCSNMILAAYGAQNALAEMVLWLQKMKVMGIPYSSRTFNSVLNSCPTITSMMQNSNLYSLSIVELIKILSEDEAKLVKELVGSCVLSEAMKWDKLEAKLDLHGMHLSSAYLIMLLWIEEMRKRLSSGKDVVPAEITIVCGSGNHSMVRGESPVKRVVKEIMVQTRSPMRIDRKNIGCFIAKGKVVKEWLSLLSSKQPDSRVFGS